MTRILIVEDEKHLATGLKFNLEAEGYAAEVEGTGEAALKRLTSESNGVDLVLLDVMLPGLDGFEVVRRLRDAGRFVPVMMLTARGQAEDILKGFKLGADDYLPKPFDLSILLARIESLLRRQAWLQTRSGAATEDAAGPAEYAFGQITLDFTRQVLVRRGYEQPLTLMEATLLRHLVHHEGRPVSRKALLEEVWGVRQDTDTRTVDNFIARLRRYIEDEPSKPKHLQTVRGVGYKFVKDCPADSLPR
ncbi:MAG: response regulator transcription factor [Vicinamibacterales bacterium]|jgi:DNA-binding response OmpR family regulator|nr:response regulator transcription factor [Vicinamibacterales bacterium]MDP7480073.1 response regulator transcription factor [Vicinamibacterales bacterium]MDP7672753.1 response regulator transcription factor [Vicinamibacterales bacterium]HJO37548.1 response regulator transcription factor [Vicinamibacterales bacterium]|tara:strand:- start:88 stop:831 length:744 start_codon:yes stop_codon:yes gene_type:complete